MVKRDHEEREKNWQKSLNFEVHCSEGPEGFKVIFTLLGRIRILFLQRKTTTTTHVTPQLIRLVSEDNCNEGLLKKKKRACLARDRFVHPRDLLVCHTLKTQQKTPLCIGTIHSHIIILSLVHEVQRILTAYVLFRGTIYIRRNAVHRVRDGK